MGWGSAKWEQQLFVDCGAVRSGFSRSWCQMCCFSCAHVGCYSIIAGGQALVRIRISSCSFERPALPKRVCVRLSHCDRFYSLEKWKLNILERNVFLLVEAAGQDMCNEKKSRRDVWQKYFRYLKDRQGSYCLYLSPAHPAMPQASELLHHRHLGMLSPLLLIYWSWLAW